MPVTVALNRFTSDTDAEVASVLEGVAGEDVTTNAPTGQMVAPERKPLRDMSSPQLKPAKPHLHRSMKRNSQCGIRSKRSHEKFMAQRRVARRTRSAHKSMRLKPQVSVTYQFAWQKHLSFSDDPKLLGAPEGHDLTVREVRLSAGAGFMIAICGSILTMPGLPRIPANNIDLNENGQIEGLF